MSELNISVLTYRRLKTNMEKI